MDWHKFWFRQSWFLDKESQWLLCVTLSAMSRFTFLGQSKMSTDGLTWNLVQTYSNPFYTACSRQECCTGKKEWGGIVFLYLKRRWRYEQSGIDVCVKTFSQQCLPPTIVWYVKSSQQQLASNSKNKNRNLKCHCKLRDNKVQELLTL